MYYSRTALIFPAWCLMKNNHPKINFGKTGILLVNLGTPDSTNWFDIRKYLKEFLNIFKTTSCQFSKEVKILATVLNKESVLVECLASSPYQLVTSQNDKNIS